MFFPLCLALLALLTGCATNPVTGEKELQLVTQQQEIAIGEENYRYMQQAEGGPFVTDEKLDAYVAEVGKKIAAVSDRPDLPYEFVVLNNSVPNAWSLPGGKIGINRGLLIELNSEAELAAVLSHEIVHSAARHGAKMMERSLLMGAGIAGIAGLMHDHKYEDVAIGTAVAGAGLMMLKYSRSAELEADKYGMKYMYLAGYNPKAAVQLQETFLRLRDQENPMWLGGLFSSHPPTQERLAANRANAAQYCGGIWGWQEYDEAIAQLKKTRQAYVCLDKGYEALLAGKTSEALSLAEQGIGIAPKEAHLYNLKGKALWRRNDLQGALRSFNKAIDLNPDYFDFYLQRGLLEKQMGNLAASRKDLEKSESLLPSAEAEYALGIIDLKDGRDVAAVDRFKRASKNPNKTGRAAQEQLAYLDLPFQPGEYITAAAVMSSPHTVRLTVENKTPAAVRNVVVQLLFLDSRQRVIGKQNVYVKQEVPAHGRVTMTAIVPLYSGVKTVQASVLSADS